MMSDVDFTWQVFAEIGALGVILWLVWYAVTKTLPGMVDKHNAALQQQRDDFRAELAEQRLDFKDSLDKDRTEFKEALERERQVFEDSLERILGSKGAA